jgi:hypothetical protein
MKYILTGSKDWADEFDVYFFEVLTEDQYKKYAFLQQTLKHFYGNYWFGTNEGWEDNDFDFLDFKVTQATDEEFKILNKFEVVGHTIINSLMWNLEDKLNDVGVDITNIDKLDYKEFCKIINDNIDEL